MQAEDQPLSGRAKPDDINLDIALRPRTLDDLEGQDRIKENLRILLEAAKARGEALDHVLFYGPPGLGKTTLAHIIAYEMGANLRVTSGPAIERSGDLAAILTNLQQGDVLFIDEVHRLGRAVEEILYPAMEDFVLDIVVGKGPAARSIRLKLPHFTVVGATTRLALLTAPLRDRFGAIFRLDFYQEAAIKSIIRRAARLLAVEIDDRGATAIASRSRGTPRVALRLLRRVRDYALVRSNNRITQEAVIAMMKLLEVDELGLDTTDRRVLSALVEKFDGGPVGLDTLAASISEEADTIMDVSEPYLLQMGFVSRTPRGRVATRLAYQHLDIPYPEERQIMTQPPLFSGKADAEPPTETEAEEQTT